MTAVERARKFVAGKGSRIALAIVPLAGLAISGVPAKAGTIQLSQLTFSGSGCSISGNNDNSGGASPIVSGGCSASTYTQAGGYQNGANAITAYTNGSGVTLTATQSGSYSLSMFITGFGSAPAGFNPQLPLNWVFDVIGNGISNATYDVSLYSGFGGDSGSSSFDTGVQSLSFSGGTASVTGSNTMGFYAGPWGMQLTIDGYLTGGGSSFTLQVPETVGGSLDVNEEQTTPEPASIALGATGLAALFLARFRRRKA